MAFEGSGVGLQYSPTKVAQAAICYYDQWLVDTDARAKAAHKKLFFIQIKWLMTHETADGRWLFNFKWRKQPLPWWSGMTNGVAISALLRAYGMTGDSSYIGAIDRAVTAYERTGAANGIAEPARVGATTYTVYQEYMRGGERNVLNGWIFALIGLYEAETYLHDAKASALLRDPGRGIDALKALLPYYDTGNWTLYSITTPGQPQRGWYQTRDYQKLVIGQLRFMATISGDPTFSARADKFQGYLNACFATRVPCRPDHLKRLQPVV